ncbi:hypothetical protein AL525_015200 [Citrobacter amalonaticus]|nr:hypothetical protein AL525_015200 [Citrobacter amalonaticus]
MCVSTTSSLLRNKPRCGTFCAFRNIPPSLFVTPLTSTSVFVNVGNQHESQYNRRAKIRKRERNRLRK